MPSPPLAGKAADKEKANSRAHLQRSREEMLLLQSFCERVKKDLIHIWKLLGSMTRSGLGAVQSDKQGPVSLTSWHQAGPATRRPTGGATASFSSPLIRAMSAAQDTSPYCRSRKKRKRRKIRIEKKTPTYV